MSDETRGPGELGSELAILGEARATALTTLPALPALFAEARTAGLGITLAVWAATPACKRVLAKRRHDIKAALRTLGFALNALEGGYRFDDEAARAKLDAIGKALQVLEKESGTLLNLLAADQGG